MKAKRKDQKMSPYEWYKENAVQIVKQVMDKKLDVVPHNLREEIYQVLRECTQFKPTVARAVYQMFGGTKILDFSAGWGDRLIAALSLPAELYVGVDPNKDLMQGHLEAITTLGSAPTNKFYRLFYEPFQTVTLPEELSFNFIFTSPPFFDLEHYSDTTGQSVNDFPKYEAWMVQFLFVSLQKAWYKLELGGHCAIHLTDIKNASVCEPMNLFIQMLLPGALYRGVIGSRGASKNIMPIWVWMKARTTNYKRQEGTLKITT
jgi:hypothetical protein